jgi:perosamine synthetase
VATKKGGNRVPFGKPSITDSDVLAVEQVLRSGWIAYGPHIDRFESALASYVGSRFAVTLNSCTSALEAVLQALGVRGEVVIPSFTWVAVANAVANAGCIPVFADIDELTFNITPAAIERCLTPETKAVIVPHYGGQPADIDGISAICSKRGIVIVEDCAETMGAIRNGRMAGSRGIGCFSFYPTKAITTAMGGAVVSDDAELIDRIRSQATHGLRSSTPVDGTPHRPWERAAVMPGRNLRMPNLLAALGLEQLKRLDQLNIQRQAVADQYDQMLADLPGIALPHRATGATHVFQMYSLRVEPAIRDAVLRHLWESGVAANSHFDPPIHRQPYYLAAFPKHGQLDATDRAAASVLTLPIFPSMSIEEVECVVGALREAVPACLSR